MSDHLSDEQWAALLRPINPKRVSTFKKSGKEFSHVEAYEIRAHLNRIFGFLSWSQDVVAMELVFETEKDNRWTVCYRAGVRLTVGQATYTEWATGDAINQPSRGDAHDLAVKIAESQGLKRCAANIGDQYGLGLYRAGSSAPLVLRTLAWSPPPAEDEDETPAPADVTEHITTPLPPENPETPARETSSPTPPRTPEVDQPPASDPDIPPLSEDELALRNAEMLVAAELNGTPAPVNPLDAVRDLATFKVGTDPAVRMRAIREAMTLATEHGLLEHKTRSGVSVGAWLTAELQRAAAEISELAKETA